LLTETVEKALNEQINKELFSAYLYLSMVLTLSLRIWLGLLNG